MLTTRSSLNKTIMYDRIGCLSDINRVAKYHNSMLHAAIRVLRGKYSHARIIYADFYGPIITILENPSRFGKDQKVCRDSVSVLLTLACYCGVTEFSSKTRSICRSHRRRRSTGLLRRRRGIQLECQCCLRHAGGDGLQESLGVRELGWDSLHGGYIPLHRRRMAPRSFCRSANTKCSSLLEKRLNRNHYRQQKEFMNMLTSYFRRN
uniref:Uncharacterized protein n=1 Tax=Aegilops tauschii subsp. strangulata TaxID=200361 RepID=A0A453KU61_AEGTS